MERDQKYLLYQGNKKRVISVDSENEITDKILDTISVLNITSANSNRSFSVSEFNPCNVPPFYYQTEQDIFVISDIEGDFDSFVQILISNKVLNDGLDWSFGSGHLVLLGDFFDRGNDVTALLWLCYKLEYEAEKYGGKVHFILGNHEQMNLQGDVRYVHPKYLTLAQKLHMPYTELYGKNSELGRWLRSKNSIEVINRVLYCHAGISVNFIAFGEDIEKTNKSMVKAIAIPGEEFWAANRKPTHDWAKKYLNMESPLWYRGYFYDWGRHKRATQRDVDRVCGYYNVDKMVVGHTLVDEIRTFYNGKVIGIDIPRYSDKSKNKPSALLIEDGKFYSVSESGEKYFVD